MGNPWAGAVASCLLVAVVVLGASGCSGEPEEATASSAATASAEPSPEAGVVPEVEVAPDPGVAPSDTALPDPGVLPGTGPAPAAPVLPAAATVPDAAGAQAFMQHWYATVNHAYAIGDGSVLEPLSHPDCTPCVHIVETIAEEVDDGGVFRDVAFLPEQLDTVPGKVGGVSSGEDAMITTGILVCPQGGAVIYPDGTVLDANCYEVEVVEFWSVWMGDHWGALGTYFPERPE